MKIMLIDPLIDLPLHNLKMMLDKSIDLYEKRDNQNIAMRKNNR